jgi:ubiquinone/menaquinone biosynthesis C-methylase UbiE
MVMLDARTRFPLPDVSFDYIASEHQISILTVTEGMGMLRECFRVLRPHGRLRIATPDLASFLGLYGDHPDDAQRHYMDWVMRRYWPDIRTDSPQTFVINKMLNGHGHQFIYDNTTLAALLSDAGFTDITVWSPGESSVPELRGVESHGRALGDEAVNRFETMVLEAVRPAGSAPVPARGAA